MAATVVENRVTIPEGVGVEMEDGRVRVRGARGELIRDFGHTGVLIAIEEGGLRVWSPSPKRRRAAAVNTVATHVRNMIKGVTLGFTYRLKAVYIHFPFTVRVDGEKVLVQNFLGERKPKEAAITGGARVTVQGDDIVVEGVDIEEVAQTAANIQQITRVKKKDRRKFLDGIYVYRKE